MKRLISLGVMLALALSIFSFHSFADELTPYDYVISQGYAITEVFESPGWRTCYLQEDSESQTLVFSDETNAYAVMAIPMLDINFDKADIQSLFLGLVRQYEWDVSFYWPHIDVEKQIAISYGITKDVDKTKENYQNQQDYASALSNLFMGSVQSEVLQPKAEADVPCDFSLLSFDELCELRAVLTGLIWASEDWQEVTVPAGVYEIGVDIPSGRWTITASDHGYWSNCKELDEYGDGKGAIHSTLSMKPGESVNWDLADGTYLEINSCSVVFSPYIGADLGFK